MPSRARGESHKKVKVSSNNSKNMATTRKLVEAADQQTQLNTRMNAGISEKGKQLSQIMEELGFNIETSGTETAEHEMLNKSLSTGPAGGKQNALNREERIYLLSVERGDCGTVRGILENAATIGVDVNCVDTLGRSALLIAIENEHIEILEVLLAADLDLGDALLHAIQEENVEAVEMILNAQTESNRKTQFQLHGLCEQSLPPSDIFGLNRLAFKNRGEVASSSFTPDITPIILAAQRDNYQIIKILLDRGDRIPKPHDLQCSCSDCTRAQKDDSLRHSKSRINAYRALASPCLIALSSKDPILTAFELSWELKRLGGLENEFKDEYENLSLGCMNFAVDLLAQTRGSDELNVILNHDIGQSSGSNTHLISHRESGERMTLVRLKLAIKYKQKQFVAHAHCQQLLASLWYEGLPGFRRKPFIYKVVMIFSFGAIFPFLSLFYLIAPKSRLGRVMRKPFIKFLCHSASYIFFLLLLVFAALRIEFMLGYAGDIRTRMKERGSKPTYVEWAICVYVLGFIWIEVKQLWSEGAKTYVTDMWNLLDFATNSLYTATITLRVVAFIKVQHKPELHLVERAKWGAFDPTLISESLFATANIFSMLKLVNIFTVNPHLGPLQISLGRMLTDILKFCCVYILVLAAFASGLNQLLWFYARERKADCQNVTWNSHITGNSLEKYQYCMTRGRYFTNLFEILQSLYWATYGLVDLENHNLEYNHTFTEFIGKTMFGAYSAIAFIVLLNMLIAMMNTSYQSIAEQSDIEWKFARSKLWVSYFEEGSTLPTPFNIIPSPKTMFYFFIWLKNNLCRCTKQNKKSKWQSIRKIVKRVNEKEARYQLVMQDLVKRYLMQRQKNNETQGVTEDDLNEIKGDISAFRFELLEILRNNGMKTPENTERRSTKLRRRGSKLNKLGRSLEIDDSISLNSVASPPLISSSMNNTLKRVANAFSTSCSSSAPIDQSCDAKMNNVESQLSREFSNRSFASVTTTTSSEDMHSLELNVCSSKSSNYSLITHLPELRSAKSLSSKMPEDFIEKQSLMSNQFSSLSIADCFEQSGARCGSLKHVSFNWMQQALQDKNALELIGKSDHENGDHIEEEAPTTSLSALQDSFNESSDTKRLFLQRSDYV